ncbi:hypothetical protein [Flagellimonas nanhaiensis]|uniref:hypothetical protein n=1 Tax=Flagellimonas nanhaiensis TaxID=2292706 RepID=UPI0015F26959|nr:hypothetical protein [Allomuricauda nanhaiensis]
MKTTIRLSLFLFLFSGILFACSNKSDDYEPPREEEEQQIAMDSINSAESRRIELSN